MKICLNSENDKIRFGSEHKITGLSWVQETQVIEQNTHTHTQNTHTNTISTHTLNTHTLNTHTH